MSEIYFDIEPFNEFSIGGCFEEAYLPAFSALNGSKMSLIINRCDYFRYLEDCFCITTYKYNTRNQLEKRFGLGSIDIEEYEIDVVNKIIEYLREKKIVICKTVNAVAINPQTGKKTQKSFSPHWILYGVDESKEMLNVIEHPTIVASSYCHHKMMFEDLTRAYKEGYDYEEDKKNMYVMYKEKALVTEQIDYLEEYKKMNGMMKEEIIELRTSLLRHLQELKVMSTVDMSKQKEVIIISELIKYFQRKDWIHRNLGIEFALNSELVKYLNLLRTYCIKYSNNASDRNHEGIIKYSDFVNKLYEQWYMDYYSLLFGK